MKPIIKYILKLFIILIIVLLFFYIINIFIEKDIYKNKEFFDINEYKKLMLNNDKKNLYKVSLDKKIKIYKDECFDRCDKENCMILNERIKMMDKCIKCNVQNKKCFNKSIIGGNCDDCNIDNIEDKLDCLSIDNFGCPSPNNLNNLKIDRGVEPYYIEVPDNNVNSPYNKKCVFCWNIIDNL
jgi:hypothetical protein